MDAHVIYAMTWFTKGKKKIIDFCCMSVPRILNSIQHINWFVVCCLIIYLIFFTGSPDWYLILKIGLGIQWILLLVNWRMGIKSNWKWAVYDGVLVLIVAVFELEIQMQIFKSEFFKGYEFLYLSFFAVNLFFLFSILYIRSEYRMVKDLSVE